MRFPRDCLSAAELRVKFDQILPHLDERRRRLYLASEAIAMGHGGVTVVAAASGASTATIARGISELTATPAPTERVRAPGAGRKPLVVTDTGLLPALEALIEPHTRGDPVSPLRWTTLSLRTLAAALTDQGHPVGATTVGHLLHALGYRLQGTAKTNEGTCHPDRDAQFAHINATATAFLDVGQPVISIDTKAKEWIGNRDRPGRTWRPGKSPITVDCHTFVTDDQPVVIPYGIYDIATNTGWVNVGTDHDTAEFAVESIRRWWRHCGRAEHPDATRLLITADAGGSNDPRHWTWKKYLHSFASESGLQITVCHYPPGTSKWNKIEHRMFCHITANWRGRPLTSYQVAIETIAATTTRTGLTIGADLDTGSYPLGGTVTPAEFHALPITPEPFHGDWNYTVAPCAPHPAEQALTHRKPDPAVTQMLTDPALTGMSRADFARLSAVSEPYWDALAEAAFHRRFHRPRSYLHPQTSSVDHFHRLLTALLRRRRAATSTLLAELLGVTRTNLSNQFQDGHRILDLHRIDVSPLPGSPARTLEQLQARLTPATRAEDQLRQ
ncbi:mobile element protein [Rhodococcus wratislaviensis]|uniref:Mobile element protein n=1 Tax=Rhodococcus wratislaviensis TaxID=44752 RepID=A0A402CM81_RHOWR|nr:mobile element protein [Rhodococcus wratislaviensis]